MTWFTAARRILPLGALSVAALAAAACSSAQTPGFGPPQGPFIGPAQAPAIGPAQGVMQPAVTPYTDGYSCYFADDGGGDRVVEGHLLHWCGPVPRPKN